MPVAARQPVVPRPTSSSTALFRHSVWLFIVFTASMLSAFSFAAWFQRLPLT